MKAIETHYIGPSNTRGSRYKASDGDGNSITLHGSCALTSEGNHKRAALALLHKMEWNGKLTGGYTKAGMVWVFDDDSPKYRIDTATE